MSNDSEERLALIGAHLKEEDLQEIDQAVCLPVENLFLSAARYDARTGIADRQVIEKVAKIRGKLIEREIFVALRYGVSVADQNEAARKCAPFLQKWTRLLTEHRGFVEMTLKIASEGGGERPDRHDFKSGAEYLRELHRNRASKQLEQPVLGAIEATLFPLALKTRWVDRQDGAIELALLVRRGELGSLVEGGTKLREQFPKLPFLLSGPWPLETFADDE